jgi:hypothetical protein
MRSGRRETQRATQASSQDLQLQSLKTRRRSVGTTTLNKNEIQNCLIHGRNYL